MSKAMAVSALLSLLWLNAVFAGPPRSCGRCLTCPAGTRCETRAKLPSIIAMHFSIRAQTAGWSLAFACSDGHCKVRNLHRPRRAESRAGSRAGSLDRFFVITVSDGAL
jgi:hypothetical protein